MPLAFALSLEVFELKQMALFAAFGSMSLLVFVDFAGAMLAFVLPVMVSGEAAVIPTRLAGWGLAGALSIGAVLLLWPQRPRDALREAAAQAALALAELIGAIASEDPASTPSGSCSG
jgi:uncharacterized membrane protein YccC